MLHPPGIPTTTLGSTGVCVTRLGLGGEGILRTFGCEDEAHAVIEAALAAGVTYVESARAYQGSERYYGSVLPRWRRDRLFIASKAHDRSRRGARAMLETTLTAMGLEYLDLWQFHDIREWSEVAELDDPNGAYAAFVEAKEQGLVRFIGVTGHADPGVLRGAFERVRFDTVLLPVNPAGSGARDGRRRDEGPRARAPRAPAPRRLRRGSDSLCARGRRRCDRRRLRRRRPGRSQCRGGLPRSAHGRRTAPDRRAHPAGGDAPQLLPPSAGRLSSAS